MKTIKIIGVALFTFVLTGNAIAQRGVSTNTSSAVGIEKEYFTDVKTLASFFIDNKIPASFPKYDKILGEEGNAKAAAKWAEVPANYKLLSANGIAKLQEYKKEQTKIAPKK